MAKKAEIRMPEGLDKQSLVVCVDGPKAGAWYFEDYGSAAWNEQVRIASMDGEARSTILGYVESGKTVPHPRWPEVRGKVLTWRGGLGGSNP